LTKSNTFIIFLLTLTEGRHMKSNEYKRQGDLLFIKIDKLPEELYQGGRVRHIVVTSPKRHKRGFILAEGEATGHHHTIETLAVVDNKPRYYNIEWNGGRVSFIEVDKTAKVEHEEHGTITLEPGIYQINHQREIQLGQNSRTGSLSDEAINVLVRD